MTQQPRDAYLSMRRFQTYFRDVIDPAVWSAAHPLAAAVHQLQDPAADPIPAERAAGLEFRPVAPTWLWGPKWSTAWFKVSGVLPAEWAGRPVALRFSSGTEGQVWSVRFGDRDTGHTTPLQGLDVNRDAYHLTPAAAGGERVEVLIEAACNHPFGAGSFEWDSPEAQQRWNSDTPGRFERCELAVFEPECWELRQHYAFALKLLEDLPLDSNRAQDLIACLRAATNAVDQNDVRRSAARALPHLHDALARPAAGSTTRCLAVGHAHLDTAWLWPIRETKRKVLRTFSNQLRNMERFPSYVFLASQTQHYAWVEERAPGLFAQIKTRVAEGRWEPGGGMWIEPDVNCVSGESLCRQILHGERWWRSRFGDKGRQRFLYLPDTFGFGSNLPQIMQLAGLDTFITNKLHWWQHTTFPHTTFVWRGIDGSTVLAHNTPGQDYNATNTPKELRKGESTHRNKDIRPSEPEAQARGTPPVIADAPSKPDAHAPSLARRALKEGALWLQPFGYGDGGGGATDWSIRFAEFAKDCDGVPRVEFSTANAFCEALHDQFQRGAQFPEWFGELDMEIHRGTLTSQAWIKKANRDAEEALRLAEILTVLSEPDAQAREVAHQTLDQAWKLTLLNQFHDILPGSSIGWVYEDAKKDHEKIQALSKPLIAQGLARVSARTPGPSVFNPTSKPFAGVVDSAGTPVFASAVPALGLAPASPTLPAGFRPVEVSPEAGGLRISNGLIELQINEFGQITALRSVGGRAITLPHMILNTTATYEDRPIMWDAWDVDHFYEEKPRYYQSGDRPRVIETSPLRAVVEITERLDGGSTIRQRYVVNAGAPLVNIEHQIDWRESHTLLRMFICTGLGPQSICTHGTHFGHQTRQTHRNTAHERARFEFPAQGWLDASELGAGLAVLAPSKFGYSCRRGARGLNLGVSLLRAPTWPDPHADQGLHEFTIGLMPHAGDWRAAGVVHQAELLRSPPRSTGDAALAGSIARPAAAHAPFTLSTTGHAAVEVSALKHAEEGDDLILRLHECHGGHGELAIDWHIPVKSVRAVDLLERESEHAHAQALHSGARTTVALRPFQIVTLRVSR